MLRIQLLHFLKQTRILTRKKTCGSKSRKQLETKKTRQIKARVNRDISKNRTIRIGNF